MSSVPDGPNKTLHSGCPLRFTPSVGSTDSGYASANTSIVKNGYAIHKEHRDYMYLSYIERRLCFPPLPGDFSTCPTFSETSNAPYYNQLMDNEGIESIIQDISARRHDVLDDDLKMKGQHTKRDDSDPGKIQWKDLVAHRDQRDFLSGPKQEPLPQSLPLEYETISDDGSRSGTASPSNQESLSDSTDGSCGSPDALTIMSHAKHQLIAATLMREFYTMFDPQWTANIRSHTQYQSGPSASGIQLESISSVKAGKRRMQEREHSPPGDGSSREEKRQRTKLQGPEPGLLFACPFNKFEPQKYCPNPTSGTKFRSCIGPGFPSIARLK